MNKEELYNKFCTETSSDLLKYRHNIINIYNEIEDIEEKHNLILDYVYYTNPAFILVKEEYNDLDSIFKKTYLIEKLIELWKF